MKLKKLFRIASVLLASIIAFAIVSPVLAIADPDDMSINSVWVYRNCKETGDQLYLIDYTIDYAVLPDETATEAYLVRLMNGVTELGAVAPYAYYDDGYGRGLAAIYFTAADAPTWEGAYDMKLIGNPALTWAGAPPVDTVSDFDLWQDTTITLTQELLSARILWMAQQLESAWSVDLIEVIGANSVLTSYGEDYFVSVVPYLYTIAPFAFAGQSIMPETNITASGTDYADALELNIIGSLFDFTDMANHFGVSRGIMTAIIYYAAVIVFAIIMVRTIGSYKPIMLFILPCVALGAFIGVPLVITIVVGFLSLALVAFALFYKPSTA